MPSTPRWVAEPGPDDRRLAWWLGVAGLVGLVAAGTLLIERIALLRDPTYTPSCSINPVLSCGSVMTSPQASLLGFPNPIIGVSAFPVLLTTAAVLLAGARPARWYWAGLQVGVSAGFALVVWLIVQSLWSIGALCPYCMVVWTVVLPTFWYVTLRNLVAGVFGVRARDATVTRVLTTWHAPVLLAAFLVVLGLIVVRFWSAWTVMLGA